jgi:hypothetical protein
MIIAFAGCMIAIAAALWAFIDKIRETVRADDWSFVAVSLIVFVMIAQAENIPFPSHERVRWWHRLWDRLGLD